MATMDAKVTQLQRTICSKIELQTGWPEPHAKARHLQTMFRKFDINNSGTFDVNEFYNCLQKLNFSQEPQVVEALFKKWDANNNGTLDFAEFTHGIFGLPVVSMETAAARDIIGVVRTRLLEASGVQSALTLTRVFREMDANGSGYLDRVELRDGLHDLGIDVTRDEMDVLMGYFDKDNSGSVHVGEFLDHMLPSMSEKRKVMVKAAYKALDVNGDGTVTLEDLMERYNVAEHPDVVHSRMNEKEVVQLFASHWDRSGDGIITFEEFMDYYTHVSALVLDDDQFEGMMKSAWNMDNIEGEGVKVLVTHYDGKQAIHICQGIYQIKSSDTERLKGCLMRQGVSNVKKVQLID